MSNTWGWQKSLAGEFHKNQEKVEKHISFKQACLNFELKLFLWEDIESKRACSQRQACHHFTSCTFFFSCTLMIVSFKLLGYQSVFGGNPKRLVTVGWYYRDRNRQVSVAKDRERDSRYLKNGVIDKPLPVICSFPSMTDGCPIYTAVLCTYHMDCHQTFFFLSYDKFGLYITLMIQAHLFSNEFIINTIFMVHYV